MTSERRGHAQAPRRQPARKEARRHARRSSELPTVVTEAESRVEAGLQLDMRDLSLGGAFLRSSLLFEVGEVLTIEFDLPGGRTICARARVVHVSRDPEPKSGRGSGMGIEFIALAEADRQAMLAFLGAR
jgi:hypothetical protein